MRRECGCLATGVVKVDEEKHRQWHALVAESERERAEAAEARRDRVLAAVEVSTPADARRAVFEAIRSVLDRQGHVSANDVRALLPAGLKPQQVGALWNAAVRQFGLVEMEREPDRYGHRVPRWTRKAAA